MLSTSQAGRPRSPRLASKARSWSGRRTIALLLAPAAAILGFSFLYPVAVVAIRSFTDPSFGLENYQWFFGDSLNMEVLARTFKIAAYVTLVCISLGYPYAYLMVTGGPWVRRLLLVAVLVPLFTSPITRSFAWIIFFQNQGVLNWGLEALNLPSASLLHTQTATVIAMSQVMMPFAVLPLYASMARIDTGLLSAAESLGARPVAAFWLVFVPQSLPGVLAGTVVVLVTSLGFYITPVLVGGPSNTLLSTSIQTQVGTLLEWGRGGAMGVVLLLATFLLLAILMSVVQRITGTGRRRRVS